MDLSLNFRAGDETCRGAAYGAPQRTGSALGSADFPIQLGDWARWRRDGDCRTVSVLLCIAAQQVSEHVGVAQEVRGVHRRYFPLSSKRPRSKAPSSADAHRRFADTSYSAVSKVSFLVLYRGFG